MSPALSPAGRGHLAMLAFSALVAGSFSLGAMVANEIDPAALTALRFLIAAAILGVIGALGPGIRRAHLAAPWRWLAVGAIYAIYFVLMFEGLKTAAPVSAAAVFTLTPVLSALFGWLILRQVTTPRMALALAIGGAGALWVIFRADLAALLAFGVGRGEAIYFVGVVGHAALPALLRLWNRGEPATVSSAFAMIAGFGILVVWGRDALRATDWAALPAIVWVTLVYLAVIASAATLFLLQYASLRLPSAKVMAYTYLVPTWVIVWEIALGRVPPPVLVLAGIGLTVVALLLLLRDEAGRAGPRARPQGNVRNPRG